MGAAGPASARISRVPRPALACVLSLLFGGRSGPRRAGCVAGLYGSGRLTRRWVRAAEDPGGDFPAQYVWVAIHAKAERADETCDDHLDRVQVTVPAPFGLSFHVRSED